MSLIDNELHSATVCAEIQTERLGAGGFNSLRGARLKTVPWLMPSRADWFSACAGAADRKIESLALMDVWICCPCLVSSFVGLSM
jgi:hypothetical protein